MSWTSNSKFVSCLLAAAALARSADLATPAKDELYDGWLKMYDLRFDEAHQVFARWRQTHAADPLGSGSDAAAYLFSELARLGVLESELFVEDEKFLNRKKVTPDPQAKLHFGERIGDMNRLADAALQKSAADPSALFAKSLGLGLRADYAALVDKQNLTALSFTKESRDYADKALLADPQAFDAYLGPGVESYMLSLKPAPLRVLLRLTGSRIDREKGLEQVRMTAARGRYLEPFAKLLLAVAALRDKDRVQARKLLSELHDRFPHNPLYARELDRLAANP